MTNIVIIAAIADNGVIGNNTIIPWHINEDLKHFKSLTLGFPCIMGRLTYQSLPYGPLIDRENIVLSINNGFHPNGITTFYDFNYSIKYVCDKDIEKAFIIGGSTIYKLGINVADYMELTFIHKEFDGDVFFPEYDKSNWEVINTSVHESIDRISNLPIKFSYNTFKRRK